MVTVIILLALTVAGIAGSLVALARDGYRPVPTRSPFDRVRSA